MTYKSIDNKVSELSRTLFATRLSKSIETSLLIYKILTRLLKLAIGHTK
jgi:hypothetical protein